MCQEHSGLATMEAYRRVGRMGKRERIDHVPGAVSGSPSVLCGSTGRHDLRGLSYLRLEP